MVSNNEITHSHKLSVCFPFVGDSIGGSFISTSIIIKKLIQEDKFKVVVVLHRPGIVAEWLIKEGIPYQYCEQIKYVNLNRKFIFQLYETFVAQRSARSFLLSAAIDIVHTNDGRMHLTWVLGCVGTRCQHIWHQRTKLSRSKWVLLLVFVAAKTIVISEYVKVGLPKRVAKNSLMLSNPIELRQVSPNKIEMKQRILGWSLIKAESTWVVGFVGTFNRQKRVVDFIETVDMIEKISSINCRYLIIGKDGDYSSKDLQDILEDRNLNNVCDVMPFQENILDWYEAMDILISPSEDEAFGRNIVEAIERGAFVVVSRSGGHPEIIEHDKTGLLVDLGNVKGYVEAVSYIVDNKDWQDRIKRTARELVLGKYQVGSIYKKLVNEYWSVFRRYHRKSAIEITRRSG